MIGNGYPLLEGLTGPFIGEAASFFKSWFLFFLLGAILGNIMERTGAASSLARAVSKTLGAKFAMPAVTIICGLLMIGGVSGFVVVFAVYPFAVELFREADIPRKYMVATIATSCAGWAMWLPGVPMTQNVIPANILGTKPTAGLVVGIICFVFQFGLSIIFTLYPFTVELFREADIPRKYMLSAIAICNSGFGMYFPGSPQSMNVLPTMYLPTTSTSGWLVSIICGVFFLALSLTYLNHEINKDRKNGLHFESRENLNTKSADELPNVVISILPLVIVFVSYAFVGLDVLVALLLGVVSSMLLLYKYIKGEIMVCCKAGGEGATKSMVNMAMIVSVAGAFKATDGFRVVVEALCDLPFNPLISTAIAVNVIAGLTASSTGGQQVALPVIAEPFMAMGAHPVALHKICSISSGVMDSMPHSGWMNTTVEVCRNTVKESYKPYAVICIGIAALTTVLAVVLFTLFPWMANF